MTAQRPNPETLNHLVYLFHMYYALRSADNSIALAANGELPSLLIKADDSAIYQEPGGGIDRILECYSDASGPVETSRR